MSELQYGVIPNLEKTLDMSTQAEMMDMQLLRDRVTEEEIADVVSRWTGIPVSKMLQSDKQKLLQMEDALHKRVIGQHEAVTAIANAVRRSRSGLSDPNRPNGSFLFLGPTGVGKTELCKALAEFLFDTEEAMVRIDMSEFMEQHSVARLIGAPPGYVGYEEGGYLTEAVRRRPYSVLLLDEVEKAHPDVFNILLQVLDDGRLTDGHGRTVDFRNTVIVMTSNLGSDRIQDLMSAGVPDDKTYEQVKRDVMSVVTRHFRPEFVNRIDETVVFHPLAAAQIRNIANIQIASLNKRLQYNDLSIEVSQTVLDKIAALGYDPVYGARPLRRAVQNWIENPLAQRVIRGDYNPGDRIVVDVSDEGFAFSKREAGSFQP
jgi:ATP-dependent Clp protease ATP-binding subunit ClpB